MYISFTHFIYRYITDTEIALVDSDGNPTNYCITIGSNPISIILKENKTLKSNNILEASYDSYYYNMLVDGESDIDNHTTQIEGTASTDIGRIKQHLYDDRKRICKNRLREARCKSHPEKRTMDIAMYTMHENERLEGPLRILDQYILTFKI